jgi:hypothetical protein
MRNSRKDIKGSAPATSTCPATSAQALVSFAETRFDIWSDKTIPDMIKRYTDGTKYRPVRISPSDGHWLDKNGKKLKVPSIPNEESRRYEAWNKRYTEWMEQNNMTINPQDLWKHRASQQAFNLSCVPDLESKIPLMRTITSNFIMDYDRYEFARGTKEDLVNRMVTLMKDHTEKKGWEAKFDFASMHVWSLLTLRIQRTDVSNG